MSLNKFLAQRYEETRDQTSVKDRNKMLRAITVLPSFVPCDYCELFDGTHCQQDKENPNLVPPEMIVLGCGKGVEDIPF